jgi:hypothetical protein
MTNQAACPVLVLFNTSSNASVQSPPIIALLIIGFADLPLADRVIESLLKARELFLLGNVKEKFEDRRVVLLCD